MLQNKRVKITKEIKMYQLLEYLKKNSDPNHPISLVKISEDFGGRKRGEKGKLLPNDYFGDKNTRTHLIKNLVYAANCDKNGDLLPKEQWKINYRSFEDEIKEANNEQKKKKHRICDIFYIHDFDDKEIKKIIESIECNKDLRDEEKHNLIKKIKEKLASIYYGQHNYMSTKTRRQLEKTQYKVQYKQKLRGWDDCYDYNDDALYDEDCYYDDDF